MSTKAVDFHKKNPHVYKTLVIRCKQWRNRHPKKKIGIRMLWEAMRWDILMQTDAPDDFKLNNNHTSYYARLIMNNEPDLAGIFDIRGGVHAPAPANHPWRTPDMGGRSY